MQQEKDNGIGAPPPYSENTPAQGYAQMPQNAPYPQQQVAYPSAVYPMAQAQPPTVYAAGGTQFQPMYTYQPQTVGGIVMSSPPNHAGLAWFSCLCCFCPLGIVAVLKSREVDEAMQRGDINNANISSRSARQFSMIAICIGVTSFVFSLMFVIFMVVTVGSRSRY